MNDKTFDPARHLTSIKGRDYLPVAARLLWLRSEHADATLETELVTFTAEIAVVKATVRIPNGGSATGYGSETPQGFADYLERAETRATGRALGALSRYHKVLDSFGGHPQTPARKGSALPGPSRNEGELSVTYLGYGTQFAGFEEGEHVAESPVTRPARTAPVVPARQPAPVAAINAKR